MVCVVLIAVCVLCASADAVVFGEKAIVLSGNANLPLAQKLAEYLQVPLGKATIDKFNDGEIQIQIEEKIRNKDVFIIQSTCTSTTQSVNDNLMELYLLIRTVKRASAASITVVIPYYGYARQDRKGRPRVPMSAADVAYMLECAGVAHVVTVDLHCGQIQGFFQNVPVDNLYASLVFTSYIANKKLQNVVVVSPDAGGVERANQFICDLVRHGVSADLAMISK
jgi:ribose-phosphate pyrophosphokinase